MLLKLPQNVTLILDSLEKSGYEAFCVGGCVRDLIMGRTPNDYDITTNALPSEIKSIFPHTADTGIRHGTVTVIENGCPIEVTTYRTESVYTDSRRPDSVEFVNDISLDLSRRDFTVNAIAYSPKRELVDPFGGQKDIEKNILRAVGEPALRFSEDALRILRLFRFSSGLQFSCEENTLKAALDCSKKLNAVSAERIAAELLKTAMGKKPAAIEPLINSGGLKFIGINSCERLGALKNLPPRENLRLFALFSLCDCDIERVMAFLKYSNSLTDYCRNLTKLELPSNKRDIKKILSQQPPDRLFDLFDFFHHIKGVDTSCLLRQAKDIIEGGEPYTLKDLAVTGEDLAALGLSGREIGRALDILLEKIIDDPSLNERAQLLKLAKEINRN